MLTPAEIKEYGIQEIRFMNPGSPNVLQEDYTSKLLKLSNELENVTIVVVDVNDQEFMRIMNGSVLIL